MKKVYLVLGLILSFWARSFASDLIWENISREMLDVRAVAGKAGILFAGTGKGLYKSEDGGNSWNAIVAINGQSHGVNFLAFDPADDNSLYAACANGLYRSINSGKDWKRIFKGKNAFENNCSAVAVLPYALYLGTENGLFVSNDKGRTWHREQGELGRSRIINIAFVQKDPNYIYVASVEGIFKTRDRGQYWDKILAASPTEEEKKEEACEDGQKQLSCIRYVAIDANRLNYVYIATSRGIYQSPDRGKSWESFSTNGLINEDINTLFISRNSQIYAAGKGNIFTYVDEAWEELSIGLTAQDVRFIIQDNRGFLYAACDKGLFKASTQDYLVSSKDPFLSSYCKDEPAISEVQEEAIKYAEVDPKKISHWRAQAAKRAILPKLSVGFDQDNDRTISNSIWGTYGTTTTAGKYYTGPDDETDYDNRNWSVTLSWELADLIWSEAQTSIDNRSKLMVETRHLTITPGLM